MDEHFCIRCKTIIQGLQEYVDHRNQNCSEETTVVSLETEAIEVDVTSSRPPDGYTGGKWKPKTVVTSVPPSRSLEERPLVSGSVYIRCCGLTLASNGEIVKHWLSETHTRSLTLGRPESDEEWMRQLIATQKVAARHFPFICSICRFYSTRLSSFVFHLNSNDHRIRCPTDAYIRCKMCEFSGRSISSILKHFRHEITHRRISDLSSDQIILKCDAPKIRFKCSTCGSSHPTRFSVKQHEKSFHGKLPQPLDDKTCKVCNKKFKKKSILKRHEKRHISASDRPFKCDECDFCFVEKKELMLHSVVHSNDKPFLCDKCSYSSRSKYSLNKHLKVHSVVKSFKCPECSFRCRLSSNLSRHKKLHTGQKDYKCPVDTCSYKTSTQENLRKHILSSQKHPGIKVYNCSECRYDTNSFSDFRSHIQKEHPQVSFSGNMKSIFSLNQVKTSQKVILSRIK